MNFSEFLENYPIIFNRFLNSNGFTGYTNLQFIIICSILIYCYINIFLLCILYINQKNTLNLFTQIETNISEINQKLEILENIETQENIESQENMENIESQENMENIESQDNMENIESQEKINNKPNSENVLRRSKRIKNKMLKQQYTNVLNELKLYKK